MSVIARTLLAFVVLLLVPASGYGQGAPVEVGTAVKDIWIRDARAFFIEYTAKGQQERGEFETIQQFEARRPQFPPDKVVYFKVKPVEHSYNMDTHRLDIRAGSYMFDMGDFGGGESTLLGVLTTTASAGSYWGTNAFGVGTTVQKRKDESFGLRLTSIGRYGQALGHAQVKVALDLPPQEAERLANNAAVFVGVRLPGYEESSGVGPNVSDATIDDPVLTSTYEYRIDATLVGIYVADESTGRVVWKLDEAALAQQEVDEATQEALDSADRHDPNRPFFEAARRGDVTKLEARLEEGTPVDAVDSKGVGALHHAAYRGRLEAAQLLVDHGATVNLANNDGWTPLHSAAWGEQEDLVLFLLTHGADVNARTEDSQSTPLGMTQTESIKQILRDAGGKM